MIIDAHTHLTEDPMIDALEKTLDDFVSIGGGALVTQSMNTETFATNLKIVDFVEEVDHPCVVKTTRGRHPWEVVQGHVTTEKVARLESQGAEMIEQYESSIVAVGECGIDLHYEGAETTLSVQQDVLAAHCRLALGYGLPIVVHSRDAFAETMDVLIDFPEVTIYMHCRGYDETLLTEFLTHCPKSYVGFCGNITYPKANLLRESLKALPLDRLVLETDAPYLTPQAVRGQRNTPAQIIHTYQYAAGLLEMDCQLLEDHIQKNFLRLYQLD